MSEVESSEVLPISEITSPDVFFQFSKHSNGHQVDADLYSDILTTKTRNLDTHVWKEPHLLPRLKEIGPKVISIDSVISKSKAISTEGLSIEQRLQRLKLEGNPNPAMLWYMQPGRPSEYANIDVNTEGKDYLLNISADIPQDRESVFKYLIADKNLFLQYVRSANTRIPGIAYGDLKFEETPSSYKNLKMLVYTSAFLTGLTTGSMPEILMHKRLTRRSFLRGLGLGMGALSLSTLMGNPMNGSQDQGRIASDLMKRIDQSGSFEESVELQKILNQYYRQLDPKQSTAIERVQARTAIIKNKLDESLVRLHDNGQSWEDLSPAVILLGNAHSLEGEAVAQSEKEREWLIQRYGLDIFQSLSSFNDAVGNSKSDTLRDLAMPSDQLKHLKLAVVDLLSFTGIERIYDPESITIREEFKDTGNEMYKPYQLLTQPQEVFESQSIKDLLTPLVSS